jgi:hypothetical protein
MKKCLVCGKDISNMHQNKKYCGKDYEKNTCSWKVAVLIRKLTCMKERCFNIEHINYKNYKDVKIYKGWLKNSFSFAKWALNRGWEDRLQIDRIDNRKGYFPSNCRFVTRSENCRNKKNNTTDWVNKTRLCRICKIIKPFNEFFISRKEIGGITYECKSCRAELSKKRWMAIKSNPIKLKNYYNLRKPYQRVLYARRRIEGLI